MATVVCATLSAIVGTPSIRVPPPCGLGISTALTGATNQVPELIRFQILKRLFSRSFSNAFKSCPSTPGAPLLAFTCRHASHTSSLGIANDLSSGPVMRPRFLPAPTGSWLIESTSPMSRPLRSTTTPASSSFTANTSQSASERLNRYSMPPVSAVGTLPLAARQTDAQARTAASNARLLTFHARAADQDHAASTPGTTWPGTRDPARLVSEDEAGPPILMPSKPFRRLNNGRPSQNKGRALLERLPGPHLTGSSPAFS